MSNKEIINEKELLEALNLDDEGNTIVKKNNSIFVDLSKLIGTYNKKSVRVKVYKLEFTALAPVKTKPLLLEDYDKMFTLDDYAIGCMPIDNLPEENKKFKIVYDTANNAKEYGNISTESGITNVVNDSENGNYYFKHNSEYWLLKVVEDLN